MRELAIAFPSRGANTGFNTARLAAGKDARSAFLLAELAPR